MYEGFSDRARIVIVRAEQACRELGCSEIGTEHLLLGILDEGRGVAARALVALGVTSARVLEHIDPPAQAAGPPSSSALPMTPTAQRLLGIAPEELITGTDYIGTEHLLLAILRLEDCTAALILLRLGISKDALRRGINKERATPPS
jgi:ATP-dependent Clp protease ATP-binding subunit ClpC